MPKNNNKIVFVAQEAQKIKQRRMSIRFGIQREQKKKPKPRETRPKPPQPSQSATSCLQRFVHYAPRRFHPDTAAIKNRAMRGKKQSELMIRESKKLDIEYAFQRLVTGKSKDRIRITLRKMIVKDTATIDGAVTMPNIKHINLRANNASQMDFIIDILFSIDTPALISFVLKSSHYTPENAELIRQFLLNKPWLKVVTLEVTKTHNQPYCTDEDQIKSFLGYNFRCDIEYSSKSQN